MAGNESGGNPAFDPAVREEALKIYPEWKKGDPAAVARMDKLYADRYTAGKENVTSEGIEIGGAVVPKVNETPAEAEDRARNDYILGLLRTDWGPEHDKNFAAAGTVARTLFGGLEEPFREMGSRLRLEFGPKGEAAAVKFLHELAKIKGG